MATLTTVPHTTVPQRTTNSLLTFHENADELVEEEEALRNLHLESLKEAAKLLKEQGELIFKVEAIVNEDLYMDENVSFIKRIIKRNLVINGDIQKQISTFRQHMAGKEEAYNQVRDTI